LWFWGDSAEKKNGIIVFYVVGRLRHTEQWRYRNTNSGKNTLEVSLDYLVGNTDLVLDNDIIKRITDIQKLNDLDKNDALKLIDMFLTDTKTRKAYAS
jgi:hypothetical protein